MKKIVIEIPDGYKLKQSEGKWELVKVKDITLEKLLQDSLLLSIDLYMYNNDDYINNDKFQKQRKYFLALSKFKYVADYLNDGWIPDWNNDKESKWQIQIHNDEIQVDYFRRINMGVVCFKTKLLAEKAIQICGEDLIRTVFGLDNKGK